MKKMWIAALMAVLCSCSAQIRRVNWGNEFVAGSKAPVSSAAAAREAAIQYLRQNRDAQSRYYLDSVSVMNASREVWLLKIPMRRGGIPGESIMGIKSKNGRVGWRPLK